ncbi:MAG: hypothetical protein LUG46_09345, partial [Erysipelotrichaceae bacterium]|nr:hypothetical protein [Erysipelotrichaceae bacterium]
SKSGLDIDTCVLDPPIDYFKYEQLSKCDNPFNDEKINLLAIGHLQVESNFEKIPQIISQLQYKNDIHCTIIGNGQRMPHYYQQIAIYDVDDYITLVQSDNVYHYLYNCDVLLTCKEETNDEYEKIADTCCKDVISIDENNLKEKRLTKNRDRTDTYIWNDLNSLMKMIGE